MMSDNHAIDNAKGWLETIQEQVLKLNDDGLTDDQRDAARQEIEEGPLSITIRNGWRVPGGESEPEEYEILLSTGGPALRIYGSLGQHNEPGEEVRLQWQDWGTPWTDYPLDGDEHNAVLSYARCFYFDEG